MYQHPTWAHGTIQIPCSKPLSKSPKALSHLRVVLGQVLAMGEKSHTVLFKYLHFFSAAVAWSVTSLSVTDDDDRRHKRETTDSHQHRPRAVVICILTYRYAAAAAACSEGTSKPPEGKNVAAVLQRCNTNAAATAEFLRMIFHATCTRVDGGRKCLKFGFFVCPSA